MTHSQSIMFVAGEASGDMHAAEVIQALLNKNPSLRIFGMGGPLMAEAGMEVREDLTRQALIGFWEVLKHYPAIRRRFGQCEKWLREEKPDLLVLVDYPGFNLRLAQRAHVLGVPVCYYIAPQAWAWHQSRVHLMKKIIRKLLVILPFEKAFFRKHGIDAVYVGHPLVEQVKPQKLKRDQVCRKNGLKPDRFPLISVMPGSRKGEVQIMWTACLEAGRLLQKRHPQAAFIVPRPSGLARPDYPGLRPEDPFFFVEAPAYDIRQICDLAWVKSGTGTLETALLGAPMLVLYKLAPLTAFFARRLVTLKKYSLVNLLADKPVVPELIQEKVTPEALVAETLKFLDSPGPRKEQLKSFEQIKKDISNPPKASRNAALEILKLLADKR